MRGETAEIVRDGLRSHRYHVTQRYCALCGPLRGVGGIRGAAWFGTALVIASAALVLILRP
jgi:hypothetical protein